MQPRFDGPDGNSQGRRDVGQRHPQEVVENDDRPPVRVQVLERPVDEVTVGEPAGLIGDRRCIER